MKTDQPEPLPASVLFAFERYVAPPVRRGRTSWLDGMTVGEVRLIPRHSTVVYGCLRRRQKTHPHEMYSWDKNHHPVAVRRDEDEANDKLTRDAGAQNL